jgi:hypothetical protein
MTAGAADHHKEHEMTEPNPVPDRAIEKSYAGRLASRLNAIAGRLRELAEWVEREATRLDAVPAPGRATYASVIGQVQHELIWGFANLSLADLTGDAQQADEYRIKGE